VEKMASIDASIPYHNGSIKLFKEKGVWNKEIEAHQEALLRAKKEQK
jgi:hypothetical protein